MALALLLWIVLPIRYIGGVVVEDTRVLQAGEPDGSRKPAELATPRRIAVTFSTPDDLEAVRADEGLGFITAEMFACDDDGVSTDEVVTQRAEYRGDYGRVRPLSPSIRDGTNRYRYRAIFDDRLTGHTGSQSQDRPAIGTPGGLCFALDGASMWFGKLWSNRVPLRLPGPGRGSAAKGER